MLDTFRFSVISPKTHGEMQNYLVCCSPSIFLQLFHLINYDTMNFQSLRKFRGKIKNGGLYETDRWVMWNRVYSMSYII